MLELVILGAQVGVGGGSGFSEAALQVPASEGVGDVDDLAGGAQVFLFVPHERQHTPLQDVLVEFDAREVLLKANPHLLKAFFQELQLLRMNRLVELLSVFHHVFYHVADAPDYAHALVVVIA